MNTPFNVWLLDSLEIHSSKVQPSLLPVFLWAALVLVTLGFLLLASPLRKEDSQALELSLLSSELLKAEDDDKVPKESSISLSKENKTHQQLIPYFLFCTHTLSLQQ